ncbi:MAG: dihydrodipicolinate synthase family protein [Chloroflexi bacterium]|nr:dihydrodipicolinate synthase family protein [Chloroflexota bacterium]
MTTQLPRLSGVVPPMITPLTESKQIDSRGLERLVTHLLTGQVAGIFVLGSSGEGPWLTEAMQAQVIRETKALADGHVPVLAGALEPGTERALEAVHRHAEAGADMVVITSPYYFQAGAAEQLQHFQTLVTHSPVPVMLYNIPPMTHNPIEPETVKQVAGLDNLVGIKDSAGNWDNFLSFLKIGREHSAFAVFQGAEKLAAKSLLVGADGIVPGLGNLVPQHFVQVLKYAQSGNETAALALQESLNQLWTLHSYDYWLPCLKYAASLLGFGSGAALGHVTNLDSDAQQAIRTLLEKMSDETLISE